MLKITTIKKKKIEGSVKVKWSWSNHRGIKLLDGFQRGEVSSRKDLFYECLISIFLTTPRSGD